MSVYRAVVYVRDFLETRAGELSPTAREMAWYLASKVDTDGSCYPSNEQIAAATGTADRRTIQRARAELVKVGLITVHYGTGRGNANVYRFPFHQAGAGPLAVLKGGRDTALPVIHKGGHDTALPPDELSERAVVDAVKGGRVMPERAVVSPPQVVRQVEEKSRPVPASPEFTSPQPPQWIAEGLTYGAWVRRERKAGRMPKHNPARYG